MSLADKRRAVGKTTTKRPQNPCKISRTHFWVVKLFLIVSSMTRCRTSASPAAACQCAAPHWHCQSLRHDPWGHVTPPPCVSARLGGHMPFVSHPSDTPADMARLVSSTIMWSRPAATRVKVLRVESPPEGTAHSKEFTVFTTYGKGAMQPGDSSSQISFAQKIRCRAHEPHACHMLSARFQSLHINCWPTTT